MNILLLEAKKLAEAYSLLYTQLLPAPGYDFLSQLSEVGLILFYIKAIHYNIDISLESFLINADTQLNSIHLFYTGYGVSVFKSLIKISLFDSIQTCQSIKDKIAGIVRSKENILGYKELPHFWSYFNTNKNPLPRAWGHCQKAMVEWVIFTLGYFASWAYTSTNTLFALSLFTSDVHEVKDGYHTTLCYFWFGFYLQGLIYQYQYHSHSKYPYHYLYPYQYQYHSQYPYHYLYPYPYQYKISILYKNHVDKLKIQKRTIFPHKLRLSSKINKNNKKMIKLLKNIIRTVSEIMNVFQIFLKWLENRLSDDKLILIRTGHHNLGRNKQFILSNPKLLEHQALFFEIYMFLMSNKYFLEFGTYKVIIVHGRTNKSEFNLHHNVLIKKKMILPSKIIGKKLKLL